MTGGMSTHTLGGTL